MMERIVRLYTALGAYFVRNPNNRSLSAIEWQATVEVLSVLDEAAQTSRQIQGGRHAHVAQAINDFFILYQSVSANEQEIRSLHSPNSPGSMPVAKTEVPVSKLCSTAQTLLKVLAEIMHKKGLGSADTVPERINLVLDSRFKSCCAAVCLNGGDALQETVCNEIKEQFATFEGDVPQTSSAKSSGAGGAGAAGSAPSPAPTLPPAPAPLPGPPAPAPAPAPSRMQRLRAQFSQKVLRPENDDISGKVETREEACLREFAEYMKEASPPDDDPNFSVLNYWKPRATDGLDASGRVVTPARWPHVGLIARLYAGIDTTSCQAERNFSALKLVVSDLRARMSSDRVEQTVFLRLNRHLIPGLGKAMNELGNLKRERIEYIEL